VHAIKGSYKLTYHPDGPDGPPIEIDFTPPFERIPIIEGLTKVLQDKGINEPIPPANTFHTDETKAYFVKLLAKLGTVRESVPCRQLRREVHLFVTRTFASSSADTCACVLPTSRASKQCNRCRVLSSSDGLPHG